MVDLISSGQIIRSQAAGYVPNSFVSRPPDPHGNRYPQPFDGIPPKPLDILSAHAGAKQMRGEPVTAVVDREMVFHLFEAG